MRILTVFGTRPEAIKLAPVVHALTGRPGIVHAICVTAQHRQMLDQVLDVFALKPEYDLNLMTPGQSLEQVTAGVLDGVGRVIDAFKPDWVIVQGDTTTAFAGALAAFYKKAKVAHVEAGLRTGNIHSPWPEEMNRRLVGRLATRHYPPTPRAAGNLLAEGIVPRDILMTGNTVIDALQWVAGRLKNETALRENFDRKFSFLDSGKRLILVTGHRRENFDGGLARACAALAEIGKRGDVEILYPVHLNPNVQQTARKILGEQPTVHLIEPQDYLPFVYLMQRASLIITDSGGIQEEAPSLGKPVLVTRDTTERAEAVEAGTARLVGTDTASLIENIRELLDNRAAYDAMANAKNPFGDGTSATQIGDDLAAQQ